MFSFYLLIQLIVIVVFYLFPASISQAILSVSRTSTVEITILMVFGILILVISGVLFPAALFSFTLLLDDFHKGEVGIGKKYADADAYSERPFFIFYRRNCRMYFLYWRAIIWVNWFLPAMEK